MEVPNSSETLRSNAGTLALADAGWPLGWPLGLPLGCDPGGDKFRLGKQFEPLVMACVAPSDRRGALFVGLRAPSLGEGWWGGAGGAASGQRQMAVKCGV